MIDRQINLNEISGYKLEDMLRDRFPWATGRVVDEALIEAAIMINSLILAIENGSEDSAILTLAGENLAKHEHIADARDDAMRQERGVCEILCREIADRRLENACCLAIAHRAEKAIASRNHPS